MEIINGHKVEFNAEKHEYYVDGRKVPSVSQICKIENPGMYKGIDDFTLQNAAIKGTNLHKLIESYEKYGIINLKNPELLNYIDIKRKYKIVKKHTERIVIIKLDNQVVCAGRFDLMAEIEGIPALIDFKRTSQIHYEYVKLQLNLYCLGLKQSYEEYVEKLMLIRLRYGQVDVVELPIDEPYIIDILKKHLVNSDISKKEE